MIFLNQTEILELACKQNRFWAVQVNVHDGFTDPETRKALYLLVKDLPSELYNKVLVRGDVAFFEQEQEALSLFGHFNQPPLLDSCVKACLICPVNGVINENT